MKETTTTKRFTCNAILTLIGSYSLLFIFDVYRCKKKNYTVKRRATIISLWCSTLSSAAMWLVSCAFNRFGCWCAFFCNFFYQLSGHRNLALLYTNHCFAYAYDILFVLKSKESQTIRAHNKCVSIRKKIVSFLLAM